jgi:hypothetical protein
MNDWVGIKNYHINHNFCSIINTKNNLIYTHGGILWKKHY